MLLTFILYRKKPFSPSHNVREADLWLNWWLRSPLPQVKHLQSFSMIPNLGFFVNWGESRKIYYITSPTLPGTFPKLFFSDNLNDFCSKIYLFEFLHKLWKLPQLRLSVGKVHLVMKILSVLKCRPRASQKSEHR